MQSRILNKRIESKTKLIIEIFVKTFYIYIYNYDDDLRSFKIRIMEDNDDLRDFKFKEMVENDNSKHFKAREVK